MKPAANQSREGQVVFRLPLAASLLGIASYTYGLSEVSAQDRCRVQDPTGTPLNLRTTPNGRIITTLSNGTLATILDRANLRGKTWVYITSEDRASMGWVFRDFLDCKRTSSTVAAEPDPDRWLIVKDVSRNTCAVLASKPISDDVIILTSFKAYVIGGKAIKDMVVAECGCERGCSFELPR
jgi:hypothetical protein